MKWGSLALALGITLLIAGCSGGGSDNSSSSQSSSASSAPSGPPVRGGAMGGMPGGMMPPGVMPPSMGMASTSSNSGQSSASSKPANTTPPSHREDPFSFNWGRYTRTGWLPPSPPPKPLPPVEPMLPVVRVAPNFGVQQVTKAQPIIHEVPQYRMVGAISGSTGRFALIEGVNGQVVVKPGDKVEGYTVTRIEPDSVVIERQVNGQTIQQVIPLSDTIPGVQNNRPGGPMGTMGPRGPMGPGGGFYRGNPYRNRRPRG